MDNKSIELYCYIYEVFNFCSDLEKGLTQRINQTRTYTDTQKIQILEIERTKWLSLELNTTFSFPESVHINTSNVFSDLLYLAKFSQRWIKYKGVFCMVFPGFVRVARWIQVELWPILR